MRIDQTVSSLEGADTFLVSDFAHMDVAILPLPALGDLTIYLRLGWLFHRAGAKVAFYSDALYSAREKHIWRPFVPVWRIVSQIGRRKQP